MVLHGGVRFLFRALGALAFLLLIGAGVFAWRLSRGPLPLDSITPYIAEALNPPSRKFTLEIGHTVLTWEGATRSVDLQITDVRARDDQQAVIASVPALALSLDPKALLRGTLAPRSIEVIRPHLRLARDESGAFSLGMGYAPPIALDPAPMPSPPSAENSSSSTAMIEALLAGMLLSPTSEERTLAALRIVDADVTVVDRRLGATWSVPRVSLEALRQTNGLGLSASLDLASDQGTTQIDLHGFYDLLAEGLDVEATFNGLRPATLANLAEAIKPLAALDLPLTGKARLRLDREADRAIRVTSATLDLTGGEGMLHLPDPMKVEVPIASLAVRTAILQQANAPIAVVLEKADLHLRRPQGREGDGPIITLSGELHQSETGVAAEVAATAKTVHFDDLPELWPPSVAPNPRVWVTQNLTKGIVSQGEWHATLQGPTLDDLALLTLTGAAEASGTTVDYLAPMPKVEEAKVKASFSPSELLLSIEGGKVFGLRATKGAIALQGLDQSEQRAVINLSVEGPVKDALTLIDSKPLGYAKKLGIDPRQSSGTVKSDIKLAFPLLKALAVSDVKVQADSQLKEVSLATGPMELPITGGDLTLAVDTGGLDARGTAFLGGIPTGFSWRENFGGKPFRSLYKVKAVLSDEARTRLKLDVAPLQPPFLSGPAAVEAEITAKSDRRTEIVVSADLTQTTMDLARAGWSKPVGQTAHADAALTIEGESLTEIPHFSVVAEGLDVSGSLSFGPETTLDRARVQVTRLGASSGEVVFNRIGGEYDITARGAMLDARTLFSPKRDPSAQGEDKNREVDPSEPPLTLRGSFDRVWTSQDGMVGDIRLTMMRKKGLWSSVQISGVTPRTAPLPPPPPTSEGQTPTLPAQPAPPAKLEDEKAPFSVTLATEAEGPGRRFSLAGDDAGALFKAMGVIGTMRGGHVTAQGTLSPSGRLEGQLSIDSYRLVKAPLLAKVLSVAALAGILDALSGEGLAFSSLEAPFVAEGDTLIVKDFRTSGPALGLTGRGVVNFAANTIEASGTVVPAYMINSLLGNIPLLGDLLTGFEKGGGIFAATYSMRGSLDDPNIIVNPLSVVTPGFLRNIFRLGDPEFPEEKPTAPNSSEEKKP